MSLYLIKAACPSCEIVATLLEETEHPIQVMQNVPITTRWCPECGSFVDVDEWDVHEETAVERVDDYARSRQ